MKGKELSKCDKKYLFDDYEIKCSKIHLFVVDRLMHKGALYIDKGNVATIKIKIIWREEE